LPSTELRRSESPRAARLLAFFVIACAVIGADQWTKHLVREYVDLPRTYAGGLLTLLRTENTGAFLSIGADLPQSVRTFFFGGFVAVLLVIFTIAVVKGSIARTGDTAAAAMVIGGGFGNLIDRLLRTGHVTDFLYLQAGALHTGVFNVADMAITAGVLWLILRSRERGRPGRSRRASRPATTIACRRRNRDRARRALTAGGTPGVP
jgi:signal peptidase II